MVAVFFEDAVALFLQPLILRFAATDFRPSAAFYLQVDSHTVGHMESGFRGTPGVETDMIQAVLLAGTVDLSPIIILHGGISCQREYAAFERTAQEDGLPVNLETRTVCLELTETEIAGLSVNSIRRLQ